MITYNHCFDDPVDVEDREQVMTPEMVSNIGAFIWSQTCTGFAQHSWYISTWSIGPPW